MSNPHAPFLMAEQQIQEIAEELNRLRDVTRLLSGAQTGIDQVLQSFQQLNERVADLTRHLQSAMMTDEAVRITKLNDTLQQVKQGLESIQVSQHESMPHLETLLKTPEYLRLAIDQQAKHHREQQVQLKHTEKSLHTQIEQAFQHTARDVHALVDRLEAIETRQKWSIWLLAFIATLVLVGLAISI